MTTTETEKSIILDRTAILHKIERIAFEIWENNWNEKEIYLIGIKSRGSRLRDMLADKLNDISDLKIHTSTILLNKADPTNDDIDFKEEIKKLDKKVVILVDDVANTGRTLCYAIKPLLEYLPKKLQIAVLLDRRHKLFPISPDYVGLSLSTTLQEHISVVFGPGLKMEAHLE